jgi:hypothetical protein
VASAEVVDRVRSIFDMAKSGNLAFATLVESLELFVGIGNIDLAVSLYLDWHGNVDANQRTSTLRWTKLVDVLARINSGGQSGHSVLPPPPALTRWLAIEIGGKVYEYPDITDPFFIEVLPKVSRHTITMLDGAEAPWSLYKAVQYIVEHRIPGDLVECGVWNGGSVLLMALALAHFGDTGRRIYLYDTFNGMSEPEDIDREYSGMPAITEWESERAANPSGPNWGFGGTLEQVRDIVFSSGYPKENFVFVKGMVEETLPAGSPETVAILRLDTDFYASTYHELVHLYPLVSDGGVVIIDDYGYFQGSRIATDQYLDEIKAPLFLSRVNESVRLAIKPWGGSGRVPRSNE